MEIIDKYFPDLTPHQQRQFGSLYDLYVEWNSQINVISRKDIDNLYERHILHSLAIAKWIEFAPSSKVLDLGCGGGFPGIPLAILHPKVKFHLVDSINKKLKVVNAVAEAIGLTNIHTSHSRVEDINGRYDFVITRAVANMSKLLTWINNKVSQKHINSFPNGLIALKGGKIHDEMEPHKKKEYYEITPLSDYFEESFFEEKYLVYVQQ